MHEWTDNYDPQFVVGYNIEFPFSSKSVVLQSLASSSLAKRNLD